MTAESSRTGFGPAASHGDPHQHPALAFHRGAVVVPVGMLTRDTAGSTRRDRPSPRGGARPRRCPRPAPTSPKKPSFSTQIATCGSRREVLHLHRGLAGAHRRPRPSSSTSQRDRRHLRAGRRRVASPCTAVMVRPDELERLGDVHCGLSFASTGTSLSTGTNVAPMSLRSAKRDHARRGRRRTPSGAPR